MTAVATTNKAIAAIQPILAEVIQDMVCTAEIADVGDLGGTAEAVAVALEPEVSEAMD